MRPGEKRPAIDIGLRSKVCDPQGSNEWIFTAALLIAGLGILVFLARRHLMPPPERPEPPQKAEEQQQPEAAEQMPVSEIAGGAGEHRRHR
ncbi:hypothetical protein DSC45_29235 [Streptomyces sp. YIM 130001]|nr:hypothetical protein DSC45_29235 [Streptomyces sp. YIM 130001]